MMEEQDSSQRDDLQTLPKLNTTMKSVKLLANCVSKDQLARTPKIPGAQSQILQHCDDYCQVEEPPKLLPGTENYVVNKYSIPNKLTHFCKAKEPKGSVCDVCGEQVPVDTQSDSGLNQRYSKESLALLSFK